MEAFIFAIKLSAFIVLLFAGGFQILQLGIYYFNASDYLWIKYKDFITYYELNPYRWYIEDPGYLTYNAQSQYLHFKLHFTIAWLVWIQPRYQCHDKFLYADLLLISIYFDVVIHLRCQCNGVHILNYYYLH